MKSNLLSALVMAGVVSGATVLMAGPVKAEGLVVNLTDKTNSNTENYPTVKVTLNETSPGTITAKVDVVPGTTGYIGDLRGVYFNLPGVSNLTITPVAGGPLTATSTNGNFSSFSKSADLQGTKLDFTGGVEIGTQGIAKGDDYQSTTFTISGTGLSLSNFSASTVGARLMSVGAPGGSRNLSSKTAGTAPTYTPPSSGTGGSSGGSGNTDTGSGGGTTGGTTGGSTGSNTGGGSTGGGSTGGGSTGGGSNPTEVPEPTTIIGSMMGLAGLMQMRRKAKANKS